MLVGGNPIALPVAIPMVTTAAYRFNGSIVRYSKSRSYESSSPPLQRLVIRLICWMMVEDESLEVEDW